ncbi:MAG: TatD family hydrolase [Candidatus Nanohaloarchaea archaeon]
MKPVDAHCHLDFEHFDGDREDVIAEAKEKLEFVVNAGANMEHNAASLELQREHPDFVVANLGLHPTYTDSFDQLQEVVAQIREHEPAAIGEIGLDYHHVTEKDGRERQEDVFRQLLALAEDTNRAVVVHSRDAEKQAVEILQEYALPDVMLHCFNGRPELAEKAASNGMTVGVSTQVLYSNRVKDIVKTLEPGEMMLETDSPFLYRGERNVPTNVLESAEKIADIKQLRREKVVKATTANAERFFR